MESIKAQVWESDRHEERMHHPKQRLLDLHRVLALQGLLHILVEVAVNVDPDLYSFLCINLGIIHFNSISGRIKMSHLFRRIGILCPAK
jgi:hypothetical protein